MKYLLAFALVAVAAAATLPEPIRLAEPVLPVVKTVEDAAVPDLLQPVQIADITPLMVPQEVMDDVALLVKFVDTAENVEAPENYAVNVVDGPVDPSDYSVNIVDDVDAAQVKLMDTPLPESLVLPLGEFVIFQTADEANEDLTVKVVDVADVDEETPVYIPLAMPAVEAVKVVDSPQESSDADFKVNFVDVADNINEEPAKVAESLPETNEFTVKIVDLADAVEESPSVIKQAPESLVEASNDDFTVKVVDVANFPKQYPNPMWR